MEFRSGRRVTINSPQLKMEKTQAKKRLTYDVPTATASSGSKKQVLEVPSKIVHSEETNESLRKLLEEFLSSECRAFTVGHLIKPAYDERTFNDCKREIETALNQKYARVGLVFKAKFKPVKGVEVRDWDGEAILLKIGRRKDSRGLWNRPPCPNQADSFTQVLQCLFAGRDTYRTKFHRESADRKFRPLLLVQDAGNFFEKIKMVLQEGLGIMILPIRPIIGQELKVFCGRCFLISSIQKSLDFNGSMVLKAKYSRSYEGSVRRYENECTIPLLYFKEFVSHSTLTQVTDANVMEIWYQVFRSFGGNIPMNNDVAVNEISYPQFHFTSQCQIQLTQPSLELCHEVLQTLTKFAQGGSRTLR